MRTLRSWMARFGGLTGKKRREVEMADELESRLEMHISDNVKTGMTPAQARREALLKLGGLELVKEAFRERSTLPFLEYLVMDCRFRVRQLRKTPFFACTAAVALGLGICVSVAIFAFVDAAVIKPLPYADPAKLVAATEISVQFGRADLSYLD